MAATLPRRAPNRQDASPVGTKDSADESSPPSVDILPPPPGGCMAATCSGSTSDGCCPVNCAAASDVDCPGCGNGRIEQGERCDPASRLSPGVPTASRRWLQANRARGTGHLPRRLRPGPDETTCRNEDECCPAGYTLTNDSDCQPPDKMFVSSVDFEANLGGLAGADAKYETTSPGPRSWTAVVALLSTKAEGGFFQPTRQGFWAESAWMGDPLRMRVRIKKERKGPLPPPSLDEFGRPVPGAVAFTGRPSLMTTPTTGPRLQTPECPNAARAFPRPPDWNGGTTYRRGAVRIARRASTASSSADGVEYRCPHPPPTVARSSSRRRSIPPRASHRRTPCARQTPLRRD